MWPGKHPGRVRKLLVSVVQQLSVRLLVILRTGPGQVYAHPPPAGGAGRCWVLGVETHCLLPAEVISGPFQRRTQRGGGGLALSSVPHLSSPHPGQVSAWSLGLAYSCAPDSSRTQATSGVLNVRVATFNTQKERGEIKSDTMLYFTQRI